MGGDGHIFVRTIQTLEKDNLTRTDIKSKLYYEVNNDEIKQQIKNGKST